MTIESLLDEIEIILEEGKTVPFTSNLLVDAAAIKTAIEDIRLNMPDELMQARKIASERKEILAGAQDNADKIIEKAHLRAKEIISEDEITRGAEAQAAVEALRRFISENFYNCTPEILEGLGQMYTADERFTESIDAAGGKGTADFVSRAIAVYCKK